jgi:hypothetical protein
MSFTSTLSWITESLVFIYDVNTQIRMIATQMGNGQPNNPMVLGCGQAMLVWKDRRLAMPP